MPYLKNLTLCAIIGISNIMGQDILTIGNSLTWDARPFWLDGNVDYHVYCSKTLPYINANPDGHCVATSTPWDIALANNSYDVVVVQPYNGSTLTEDIAAISSWVALAGNADFVINTGWAGYANLAIQYETGSHNGVMTHTPSYFADLVSNLEILHPGTTFSYSSVLDQLYAISQDIENGVGPYSALSDLYRDPIHLSAGADGAGRYLAHNSLRQALGQPLSISGFEEVTADEISYLNNIILSSIPEPSSSWFISITVMSALAFRNRKSN